MTEINLLIAFIAGLLSFLSPCVLPLVPSYVSYVTGVSLGDLSDSSVPNRREVVLRTLMFVLGFSVVFVSLGVVFSGSAVLVGGLASWVNMLAGTVVIILGLNVIFDFASFLNRERRAHLTSRPTGYIGSAAVGMAFGAGWTPCIGPVLAGILFMAGTGDSVGQGAILLFSYSLGLGSPFLLASAFFSPTLRYLERIKPQLGRVKLLTGILLIVIGVFVATGRLQNLQATLYRAGTAVEAWAQGSPALAYWVPTGLLAGAAVAMFAWAKKTQSRWKAVFGSMVAILHLLHVTDLLPVTRALALWFTYEGI